jgi:hypothetical protein
MLKGLVAALFVSGPTPTAANAESIAQGAQSRSRVKGYRLAVVLLLVLSLVFFGYGTVLFCGSHVGAPTTATIVRCHTGGRGGGPNCDGTWTIGGESHTGWIMGEFSSDHHVGSSLDVRVLGGTAFSTTSGKEQIGAWVLGGILAALLVLLIRRGRRAGP